MQDVKRQDEKWNESLFWDLTMITPEAQAYFKLMEAYFHGICTNRSAQRVQERASNVPAKYSFPHRSAASTRRVHKVVYGGEVIVSDRWRDEFGEEIRHADEHFLIALQHFTSPPPETDEKITAALKKILVCAVCRPEKLKQETRDSLSDLLAAEEMKKNCANPNQGSLRDYADEKRKAAIKTILKCQQDEFRRGKVLSQKGYGIPAAEVFAQAKEREEMLAARLLRQSLRHTTVQPEGTKKRFYR